MFSSICRHYSQINIRWQFVESLVSDTLMCNDIPGLTFSTTNLPNLEVSTPEHTVGTVVWLYLTVFYMMGLSEMEDIFTCDSDIPTVRCYASPAKSNMYLNLIIFSRLKWTKIVFVATYGIWWNRVSDILPLRGTWFPQRKEFLRTKQKSDILTWTTSVCY